MSDVIIDQAAGLRRIIKPRPVRVLAVSSGKGGVGKTNVSVNLGIALAQEGKEVMLMDADFGLANVVPASSGVKKMAELDITQHAGVIRAFSELSHQLDVLIIDTAAGISESVVSYARAAQEVVVVVCDEPASITDAYALIKLLNRDYGINRFRILANMVLSAQEGRALFQKLTAVTDRYLDIAMDFMGAIPYDDYLKKAVQKQRAVVEAYPRSKAALAFKKLAQKTDHWPLPSSAGGHLEFFVERLIMASQHVGSELR